MNRSWRRSKIECPRCGSTRIVPIVYGLPLPDTAQRAALGEVALGGCIVRGDDPAWSCQACGHRFDEGGPPRKRASDDAPGAP